MTIKQIHLGVSIASFLLGLILFLSDLISDATIQRLGLLFFGLLIIGWYGITRYIYDK